MKKSYIVAVVVIVLAAVGVTIWAISNQSSSSATSYNPAPVANPVANGNPVTPPGSQPADAIAPPVVNNQPFVNAPVVPSPNGGPSRR